MRRRQFTLPPDPVPASPLCQVVTGEQGAGACDGIGKCDCMHQVRRAAKRKSERGAWWYVSVDNFSGTAVTYFPIETEEPTRELITEPELAGLL